MPGNVLSEGQHTVSVKVQILNIFYFVGYTAWVAAAAAFVVGKQPYLTCKHTDMVVPINFTYKNRQQTTGFGPGVIYICCSLV